MIAGALVGGMTAGRRIRLGFRRVLRQPIFGIFPLAERSDMVPKSIGADHFNDEFARNRRLTRIAL